MAMFATVVRCEHYGCEMFEEKMKKIEETFIHG